MFGGSFDPIHHGHLLAARTLLESLELDQVRLIPAAQQPFKTGRHGASPEHRVAMVELAVQGESGLVVDRVEAERPGPSYTVETVSTYRARWPDASLVLLLGSDAAKDFESWRQPDRIQEMAEVVIFTRGPVPPGAEYRVVEVPRIDISATTIRTRVRAGQSIRYFVPDAVAGYIETHGLYR